MKHLVTVVLLIAAGMGPAAAQTPSSTAPPPDSAHVIHITGELKRTPAAQRAIEQFQTLKRRGQLPMRRQQAMPEVGDTRTFSVYNHAEEGAYDEIQFTLQAIQNRYLLWVETAELENDHVRPQDIDNLVTALSESTPCLQTAEHPDRRCSINPDEGVIVNDEEVFGTPPDIDGNEKSDVLLVDVRDDYSGPGSGFVAGFVNSADLGSDPGNERDILYLDTYPGIFVNEGTYRDPSFLAKTAAHEYQHLIQLNYDRDELTFVDEGLSEWAEVMNGYAPRNITYLSDPDAYNIDLFHWDFEDPFQDYQRAGLFTNYIAERIGPFSTGEITQVRENGVPGYREVLGGQDPPIDFQTLLLDFHTANFLNDSEIDARYGYSTPVRQGILAEPTRQYSGWTANETPLTNLTIQPGAAVYLTWENVEDFNLSLDVTSGAASERAQMRLRVLRETTDGTVRVDDYSFEEGERSFPGSYEKLTAVVANVEAGANSAPVSIEYAAQWAQEQTFERQRIVYDDGEAVPGFFFGLAAEQDGAFANRFIVPQAESGTILDKVFIAPFFANQFSNSTLPEDALRNLRLVVWESENGQPGDTLYSRRVQDPRAFFQVRSYDLRFFEVDLADEPPVKALPDTIFVGYTELGTDENFLTASVSDYRQGSPYADRNMSFIGNWQTNNWIRLWDVELSNGDQVGERVLPIRASFAVPVATGPPPIRLAANSFQAAQEDEAVVLTWRTAEEGNDSEFIVQRSRNGNTFVALDTLQTQGTSQTYTYRDEDPPYGADTLYYRLKLSGPDGAFSYSERLEVHLQPPQRVVLHGNFPNPFAVETTIRYELPRRQHVTLAVYDMLGRKVAVLVDEVRSEGEHETVFEAQGLPDGVYVYVLETESATRTHQMVLVQ